MQAASPLPAIDRAHAAGARRGTLFSLGGLIAGVCPRVPFVLPWAAAASLLASGAIWDKLASGGQIDFILLGLAGYELVRGLTVESPSA